MNNIPYLLALHCINGLGPIRLKAILDYFKDPKIAWEADASKMKQLALPEKVIDLFLEARKKLNPVGYAQSITSLNIKWLTIFDESYPKLLSQIYDPPVVLYYQGQISDWNLPAIAVVGTRKITGYGKAVTEQFTKELVSLGLTIVSGLALGVDTQAHMAAIRADGQTWAVLGSGINQIYPAQNRQLARQIMKGHGAIISEFPPDLPSLPGNFPARNRVISGLSQAVLVTEAAEDSGSLITARAALEQGKEVFAIPGPITSPTSKGTAMLIKQGARLVTEPEEILEELGINPRYEIRDKRQAEIELTESEKQILNCISSEQKHLDEICRELNLTAAQVSASLIKMEIKGLVRSLGGGIYMR